ncbi:MAG: RHS repeat protein, partial [Alphaproteobacteria bacterium]|nr:RHS repeat protein [Alphaproteobacteria bacterium]MBV9370663.1 RHS repeat protein [Alphaproteobacteria bacterium]MBV9902179.1 RHS repeat protein [Alphaproteobacteria bacterium]
AVRRCAYVAQIVEPDGTRLGFDYVPAGSGVRLARVTSSRGYALILEGSGTLVTKACVLNLAAAPAPAGNACPAGVPTASYGYAPGESAARLATVTRATGGIDAFFYSAAAPPPTSLTAKPATAMAFYKAGQPSPWLINTLFPWADEEGVEQEVVARQDLAGGARYDYRFDLSPPVDLRARTLAGGAWTDSLGAGASVAYDWPAAPGQTTPGSRCAIRPCAQPMPDDQYAYVYQQTPGPVAVSDALGRATVFAYCDGAAMASADWQERHRCIVLPSAQSFTGPDGARTDLRYDGNRNIVEVRRHPRPGALNPDGSVPADLVTSAVYDVAHPKSASRPLSMTDARGNRTDWTYAPEHGGVLTETGPAPSPGAPRPQTRYAYAQLTPRYADGTAGAPVWLPVRTSACRTGPPAADGNGCANGPADEVVTLFDYGPATGPSNLLLRSKLVDAGGLNLRTCFFYDALGNRIAETSPRGAANGCPAALPAPFTAATRYDAERHVTGTIAPDPDGEGPLRHAAVRNSYDPAGRLVRVETGELAQWQSEAVAPRDWPGFTVFQTIDTAYDPLDRKLSERVSGPAGAESLTQMRYDPAGRLLCTAVRMNKAAFGAQDDACALGPAGSQGPDRITRNEYDAAGELVAVWKAWGVTAAAGFPETLQQREVAYEYGPTGQRTAVIDANGNRAELRYDGFDREARWVFPSPSSAGAVNESDYEAYGYDANGNRTSLRKRDGAVLAFDYDALNRVTRKVVPERAGLAAAQTRDVFYRYDNRGLQLGAWYDGVGGEGVSSGYDAAGRLV